MTVLEKNYLEVYPFESWSNSYLPEFKEGELYNPTKLEMVEGKTYLLFTYNTSSPPQMLTEADLITLMDKNGIGTLFSLLYSGTDATIHEHIKKIQEREYANKQGDRFYPTTLGMALVKGYDSMEMALSLSKPYMRSQMENSMRAICEGQKSKEVVIAEGVELYREAFAIAESQEKKLFEVIFTY